MKHSEEALKVFSSMTSMEICKAVEYILEEKYGKVSEIDKIWLSIIRKDLEVLELIKQEFGGLIEYVLKDNLGESELNDNQLKIKEWLDGKQ